jgi:putative membrane protein
MPRYSFVAICIAMCLPIGTSRAAQRLDGQEIAFLQHAAREQLAEIALGKLAMEKAFDKNVKELGTDMVEDHQYASGEIQDLAAEEEIYLPVEMDVQREHAHQRLSHLSGNEFDKAFIAYLLKHHRKMMKELQDQSTKLQSETVKQWAEATEPIVAVHLKKAEHVADRLAVNKTK